MRKLASIQKIEKLQPIESADSIELATVLGWNVVVKKGEFNVGDLVVYCEIDSVLPDKPEFSFLRDRGMRIKTIKLKGQISQGICFPLSILLDADVTDILEIKKYEPLIPECVSGVMKSTFPSFIPKTDETRVQVLKKTLEQYAGSLCYVAEKIDGSSATYFIKNGEFGVCSRNMELSESENSYWKIAEKFDIENKLRSLGLDIAIQGELYGEKIQGNKLGIIGQTIAFFSAFDIAAYKYLDFSDFIELFKKLDLPIVPIVNDSYVLPDNVTEIVEYSKRNSILNDKVLAEGIVIRLLNNSENRISFKAINPDFLIKYKE